MTQTGRVIVLFSRALMIDELTLDSIDISKLKYEVTPGLWSPVLTIEVKPSIEQDPSKVGIKSWSVIKFDPSYLEIQLIFENPLYISFE